MDYLARCAELQSGVRARIPSHCATGDAMASMPCALCNRVPKGKLHTCIWAWGSTAGRRAYRVRVCANDLTRHLESFGDALPEDGDYVQLPTSCPLCQEPVSASELAITWLTWYESDGKHSAMFATCSADSDQRRFLLSEAGEALADRDLQNRRRAA